MVSGALFWLLLVAGALMTIGSGIMLYWAISRGRGWGRRGLLIAILVAYAIGSATVLFALFPSH